MAQNSISHFSHPGHGLVKQHYTGSFRCDMCWEDLSGPAYGCHAGCDFAIHDSCAGHPQTLSFPAHHAHPLVLVQTRRDVAHCCGVCAGRCAPGCFLYRCPPCRFDMHPRCARLPQAAVRSSRHPEHDPTLVVAEGNCNACHVGAGRGWFYRCAACNVDFHVSCASAGGEDDNAGASHDGGNGHATAGATTGATPQARDLAEELRRARTRAADVSIARANATLNRMSWIV